MCVCACMCGNERGKRESIMGRIGRMGQMDREREQRGMERQTEGGGKIDCAVRFR